jgi:hypothetical protein
MRWQRPLAIALAPYAAWLVFAYEYHFLDGVNLAFHEAGHLFLRFGGETLHFLGGTIGQLFFPALLAARFAKRGESFEAAVCTLWVGESLMYAGVYLGDARAQALPLVGGHVHDWHWLLRHAGLLGHAESLARLVHVLASAVVIVAWLRCARAAFSGGASAAPARRASAGSASGPSPREAAGRPS